MAAGSLVRSESPAPPAAPPLPPQVQRINGVLVPVPREIFRVLDSFPEPNWQGVLRPDLAALQPAGDPSEIALSLGLVVGEGFVAIAARDAHEMEDLGRAATKLARALGVEKSVLRREKSIVDHAGAGNWAAVRAEWSSVDADLKEAMLEIRSQSLSQLVSLGGWLRGLDALAALVAQRYSATRAQLLSQPFLLAYFAGQVGAMESRIRDTPALAALEAGFVRLQPLVGKKDPPPLSEREVREVRAVSGELVAAIARNAS